MFSRPPSPSSLLSLITFRLYCACLALLISSLCAHVLPVSAPRQSIDPGQQFTWEHSNLEVNKPKNRYANVIAYDHSRVILAPIEGKNLPVLTLHLHQFRDELSSLHIIWEILVITEWFLSNYRICSG